MSSSTPNSASSPNRKTLSRSPSYMGDGSPHRHMKSYDEEWVHQPLARVNHLGSSEHMKFSLNLRPDDRKPNTSSSPRKMQQGTSHPDQSTGAPCSHEACKRDRVAVRGLQRKNADIILLILQQQEEHTLLEDENGALEAEAAKKGQAGAASNTRLYEIKVAERKRDFPTLLEKIRTDRVELQQEIDDKSKLLLRLRRQHANRELPHAPLFPEEELRTLNPPPLMAIQYSTRKLPSSTVRDQDKSDRDTEQKRGSKGRYFHSGTFMRCARTRWEPCWTCCMSTESEAQGCHYSAVPEDKKQRQFKRSQSEKGLRGACADQWTNSRLEERPGVREFRQWSSATLKPSASLKVFPMNRLYKTNHKANSYTQLVVSKPIF